MLITKAEFKRFAQVKTSLIATKHKTYSRLVFKVIPRGIHYTWRRNILSI